VEKNTLASPAAEIVKAGALTVFHNNLRMIHLNVFLLLTRMSLGAS
jgi:hypothetical protein